MNLYENRLKSFEYWPGKENKEKLALVGFYHTGYADVIICYYCKLDLYNFTLGDEDSLRDHKRYSPDCPFFVSNTTNYVNTRFLSPRTVTSNYPLLTPIKGDYTLLEHRINSYQNFPQCLKVLVSELCNAGFYYLNVGDVVCCYVCNIIARNWNINSNVWKIHKYLNDKCPLLYLNKLSHNNNQLSQQCMYDNESIKPSAPVYEDGHYNMPKCLKCKTKYIDAVLLPCFHYCMCQECALTCTKCDACNVFTGGFFAVKVPVNKLNTIEHERLVSG
ncbi:iap-5 [Matsumuraeses phaseoli granulovirus]|uniref:Iap-5 n=1 Tax=Matsumuraeses phaseoli granulovirus TaxID=2760664 RepID=A0AAE7MLF8_9BBAC|nr:iap-5 [Matsumuraeses phaseoli granulovirus]QOD40068.1 iap-5 [Matsumuraeses phaseoli granulovirus]